MLVSDLITQAFVNLAVIQPGMGITNAMQTDGFTRINQVLGNLSTEELTDPNQVLQTFPLAPNLAAYTLGNGGSWPTTGGKRASKVTSWRASYGSILSTGGRVLSLEELAAIPQIGETSVIPRALGADTSFPLINIRVLPVPSVVVGQVELAYYTPLTAFAAVGDAISLPPGWEQYLPWELALQLFSQYARPGQSFEAIAGMAQRSKASIVTQNTMKPEAKQ
jgi:hypothetical protein